MNYQKINNYSGWAIWLVATIVYVMTIEDTTSLWDCAEFIASANGLEPGHPPGAPFWMLMARLVIILTPAGAASVSVNILSALSSSFTILFLFWGITYLVKKMMTRKGEELDKPGIIAIIASGAVGALTYTFTDSFWFSAVEGEVYAMSSLFTALIFWLILKWEARADKPGHLKWIILIAYVMGLSIGVHLLNLLAIPAICFIWYFKRYEKVTPVGLAVTGAASLFLIGLVNVGIIKVVISLAGKFELFFINSIGAGFNTGVIVYAIVLIGVITGALWYTRRRKLYGLNTLTLGILTCLIGYSTFALIVIRSNANTPMDENNPENLFSFLSYLNREQYGNRPLLHGAYFNAPLRDYEDGADIWIKSYSVHDAVGNRLQAFRWEWEANEYIEKNSDKKLELVQEYVKSTESIDKIPVYDDEFTSFFPRMHSGQAEHEAAYKRWSNYKGWNTIKGQNYVRGVEEKIAQAQAVLDTANYVMSNFQGNSELVAHYRDRGLAAEKTIERQQKKLKPTKAEDMRYFFSYQLNWMYWRYFMWNFSGRQNDEQGSGSIMAGNWITGIDFIDEQKLGNRDKLSDYAKDNKGFNKYYMLPFILGLIGMFYHMVKAPKDFWVILLLFVMTGIAIIVYLNQPPIEPRERDYTSVGSFYAFAFWIGIGVFALYDMARNLTMKQFARIAVMSLGTTLAAYLVELIFSDSHFMSYCLFYISFVSLALIGIGILLRKSPDMVKISVLATICMIPPLLMGAQNWDDHDRSGRTTALAFAKNYLDSLAPNAIIFTMGDNDTFPLWYAQEVEGYRRDVRVVNLSLLNTDWYIDQMKRKAYNSDPVPFSIPEIKYRQGTRDIILLDQQRNQNNDYVDVDQAMEICLNDKYKSKAVSGKELDYLPTNKFSLPVDSAYVLSNGTVSEKYAGEIVDNVEWTIQKPYVLKASMMVLDMLRTNNWERPIYFAVTTGDDAYIGLQEYFQLEGLAYRLVPVKFGKNPNPNFRGGMNTDIMYPNMMEKFTYGGLEGEEIYVDETNRRMTVNIRLQFNNLAEELIKEGQGKKALAALDKCLEVTPEHNVPYDRVIPGFMDSYLKLTLSDSIRDLGLTAEEKEQAKVAAEELASRMFEINEQEIEYYMSLEPEFAEEIQSNVELYRFGVNDQILQLLEIYLPESELIDELTERHLQMEENLTNKRSEIQQRKGVHFSF